MTTLIYFRTDGMRYAMNVQQVAQVAWLPALSSTDGTPVWLAGVLNWQGHSVPVIDVARFMGHPARAYTAQQKILVLVSGVQRVALIVDDVDGIEEAGELLPLPAMHSQHSQLEAALSSVLLGQVRHGDDMVMLLKAELLLDVAPFWPAQGEHMAPPGMSGDADGAALFIARMHRLAASPGRLDVQGQRPFAIVTTGDRRFAIPLDQVVAFTRLRPFAWLPGSPASMVGCMNLRGEIVAIVDIGPLSGSAPSPRGAHVVVLQHQGHTWACLITSVERLVTVSDAQVTPMHGPDELHPLAKTLLHEGHAVTPILHLDAVLALCDADPHTH